MFTSFDIYGHAVGVNYKGNGVYRTRLGAAVTLVTYALDFRTTIVVSLCDLRTRVHQDKTWLKTFILKDGNAFKGPTHIATELKIIIMQNLSSTLIANFKPIFREINECRDL